MLATAALVVPAVPARAQSGAGDDQYTDPFGGSNAKTQTTAKARRSTPKHQASGPQNQPSLSTQPPVSSTPPPSATSPATTTPSATPSATATGELPRTGLDVPGMALLGAGLLATGIGLRLRTADESIF